MKFYYKRFVRSRDIDVLVLTGCRFDKPEVYRVHLNTQKYIFFESDDHANYKNIFCFEIRAKLRILAQICKF